MNDTDPQHGAATTPLLAEPRDVTPPAAFVSNAEQPGHAQGEGAHRIDLPPLGTGPVLLMGAAFVAMLGGLFALGFVPHQARTGDIEARARRGANEKPRVSVVSPKPAQAPSAIVLPGTTRAFQSTAIYPRASGYLSKLNVDIGDRVKAGQVLAEIETPELDAQLAAARATLEQSRANAARAQTDLELAKTTLDRYEEFAKTGGVTQQQLDERRGAFEQAKSAQAGAAATVRGNEAEVQRLTSLQSFQKVVAPFDGTITMRNFDVGSLLAASGGTRAIFQLDQTDTIRVYVDVPQTYATQIRVGNVTRFTTRADPVRPFEGTITRTAGAIDETTRTLRVEADFVNGDGRLLPGMYGEFAYEVGAKDQRPPLVVPTSALVFDSKGTRLATVDAAGKVAMKPVTLGRDYGTEIEVTTGLDGAEQIVNNPGDRIADGVEVEINRPADAAGPAVAVAPPASGEKQAAAR